MVAAWRTEGIVTVPDVANLSHPRIIGQIKTNASPAKAVFAQSSRICLPGGLSELLINKS